MSKNISSEKFQHLLDYYIKCIEREDMLSLTYNFKSDGDKFHSNLFQKEELFFEKKEQTHLEKSKHLNIFLEEYKLVEKNKSLFYGYPIVLDSKGKVSPIFFNEIFYEEKDDEIIFTKASAEPEFNHYILQREGFNFEEIEKIIIELDEEDGFVLKLEKICEILNLDKKSLSARLDDKKLLLEPRNQLINKAILYSGTRSGIVYNLLSELTRLRKQSSYAMKSSSLSYFLSGISNDSGYNLEKPIIEIFPMNNSQEHAVKNALTKHLTIVTGPPGTGKSQVVLNIMANAIINNKTVLFASKNNKAVDVVIDKFDSILSKNPIVRMGSREHRRQAREKLENILLKIDEIKISDLPENCIEEIRKINRDIDSINSNIKLMSDLNESIDSCFNKMNDNIKELPLELYISTKDETFEEFDKYKLESDVKHLKNYDTSFFIRLLRVLFKKWYINRIHRFFNNYYSRLPNSFKKYVEKTISLEKEEIIKVLHWILQCKNIDILKNEINDKREKLAKLPSLPELNKHISNLHEKRLKHSRPLFFQHLNMKLKSLDGKEQNHLSRYFDASEKLERYVEGIELFKQLGSDQKQEMYELLNYLPIWVVTNLSVKNSIPFECNLFDILIIDEASQCDIASALPLIYRAKQIVIIGDPKQLKHISLLKDYIDKRIATEQSMEELYLDYTYTKNSLYDLAERTIKEKNENPILLIDHYRSHMDIINFSNGYFYDNKLNILTNSNNLIPDKYLEKRFLWNHIQGRTAPSKSPYCIEEATEVVDQIIHFSQLLKKANIPDVSFGVVTLFRAQMELIERKINESELLKDLNITVGTAHRFQGDEKDIIIFSPAVSEGARQTTLNWIHSTHQLLNVAITRARSGLVIVGNRQKCLEAKGILRDLVEYSDAKKTDEITFDSNIEKILYTELTKNEVNIAPQYWTEVKNKKAYRLDFALFVNGQKYNIEIDGDKAHSQKEDYDILRDIHLRMEGWKIRRYSAIEIQNKLDDVVDEIKRLC